MNRKLSPSEANRRSERRQPRRQGRLLLLSGLIVLVLSIFVSKMGASTVEENKVRVTPISHAEADASSTEETPTADDGERLLVVDLEVQGHVVGEDRVYIFAMGAMTTAPDGQVVTFPTGQAYDFVVTQGGREVWRWSRGLAFHQAVVDRSFEFGQMHVFIAVWDGRDTNGDRVVGEVEVHGVVTSTPRIETDPVTLFLD